MCDGGNSLCPPYIRCVTELLLATVYIYLKKQSRNASTFRYGWDFCFRKIFETAGDEVVEDFATLLHIFIRVII